MEIAADVADADRSVILDQVTNGVHIRMAVLYLLMGGQEARQFCGDVRPLGGDAVDVRIEDGVIAEIGQGLDGDDVVEGHGAVLLPGLVDLHTHLREPGRGTPRR